MIQIILYHNWMLEALRKVHVKGKKVPQISASNIKEIIRLCKKACKTADLKIGTLYQIK